MSAVYLSQPALQSALAGNLSDAACRYAAGQLPTAGTMTVAAQQQVPFLFAQGSATSPLARIIPLLQHTLEQAGTDAADCLLLVASTTLDVNRIEQRLLAGAALEQGLLPAFDDFSAQLRSEFAFAGITIINTACTSAANGLLYGQRLLNAGLYRRVLLLAFDTPGYITASGFTALELTSRSGLYRPFHPQRDGLIIGETYAAVMLSSTPDLQPVASLLGGASACDTYNITTTAEDGSHIAAVMQQALSNTGLTANAVELVKLHGTATAANDVAEQQGLQRVFAQQCPPLALLKPYLGHSLGACGLSETLLLLQALAQGSLPAVPYAAQATLPLPQQPVELAAEAVLMANFFGFGGNNASLLLRRSCSGEADV